MLCYGFVAILERYCYDVMNGFSLVSPRNTCLSACCSLGLQHLWFIAPAVWACYYKVCGIYYPRRGACNTTRPRGGGGGGVENKDNYVLWLFTRVLRKIISLALVKIIITLKIHKALSYVFLIFKQTLWARTYNYTWIDYGMGLASNLNPIVFFNLIL